MGANPSLPRVDRLGATFKSTVLADHNEDYAVDKDGNLLHLEDKIVERGEPVHDVPASGRLALEDTESARRKVVHDIGSGESHYRVDVAPVGGLDRKAPKLDQVGGRGLLRHRPPSIPQAVKPSGEGPRRGNSMRLGSPSDSRSKSRSGCGDTASVSVVRPAIDVHAADWVIQGVHDFDYTVGSLVPALFEQYARLFHPASREDGSDVRWADVASANGRTMHPAAEWGSLTGSWQMDGQPDLWDQEPRPGQLPQPLGERLAETLASFTERADRCFFGVWEGWGAPSVIILFKHGTPEAEQRRAYERADAEIRTQRRFLDSAPTFTLPHRGMHLLEGPLTAISAFYENYRDPPSLWWPEDRAWCVATDIDLMSTYVGGSADAIQALLSNEQNEAFRAPVDQSVTWEADTINPLPKPPS
jgi:hypothetical protein